ncbi:YkgJ family cysteine cluster protein [Roseospira marina]|uniref:YkgJ family cysteine cluster protein n=1 Tax=Roseospira marina TaxID=140057 RepID=A0A5M6I9M2_9PROT|nr:YkgJ family cysteine cluster protein [Roseospira marina]KAA5604986.1 YkgJ family cysteine cluster protein [Roseospira marina]MBB4315009.1 Fe-S-cluster containining protein [Roseospira marina]MBB5088009.1 Fe-S-cluster containining protein [Roseospira marina]
MARRFACTLCGKCCVGLLPLTIEEAVARADRFPLALVWTPVRKGAPAYATIKRLGLEVTLGKGRTVAVLVSPMVYLPPAFPCPDLTHDGLCAVHDTETKPLRCRAMPFNPRRPQSDQAALLLPRPGWTCDISAAAPEVYQDEAIIEPGALAAYTAEREALRAQAPILRAYAESRLSLSPSVMAELNRIDRQKGSTGTIALSFTALLPRLPEVDAEAFVRGQRAVLADYRDRTAPKGDEGPFHRYYGEVLDTLGPASG